MQRPEDHSERGPDLALWEAVTTAYRTKVNGHAPPPGSNRRTETARARRMPVSDRTAVVDLYIDRCALTRGWSRAGCERSAAFERSTYATTS